MASGDSQESTETLLQFFTYDHLPEMLQAVSKPLADLAHEYVKVLPRNSEGQEFFRKLLEAKDCAVRSMIQKDTLRR